MICGVAGVLASCSASDHARDVGAGDGNPQNLTVGKVQSEIQKGMGADKVVESLGSPNIVTTDELGREVWVYDRFATDVVSSQSSGGVFWIIGVTRRQSGAESTSQRSLTVIIKYDEQKKVRDVAYHSSKF